MKTTIFTVGSVTLGMKARRALSKKGIRTRLVKLDGTKTANGCTFGIEFETDRMYSVGMELSLLGIPYELYTDG